MVWLNDSEYTHASVCLVRLTPSGEVHDLLRLMDYRRSIDGSGSYRWVLRDDTPQEARRQGRDDPDDPKTMYNPDILDQLRGNAEDFIFVKWSPNMNDPKRPWLLDPYARPYGFTPDFYEVINCPDVQDERGLRLRLALGWPYSGTPTRQVLIPYSGDTGNLDAILIDRDQLDWSGGVIHIKPDAALSARHCVLDSNRVHEAYYRVGGVSHQRYLYDGAKPPVSKGNVLIRPLTQYAAEYVQWYFRDRAADMGDMDEPHIAKMIAAALDAPDRLNTYVGLKVSHAEIAELRKIVTRATLPGDDTMAKLVSAELMNHPEFAERCRAEALKNLDEEADKKREQIRELETVARQRAESNERLAQLEEPLKERSANIRKDIDKMEHELQQIRQRRDDTLARLDQDVALKLGLRAAVTAGGSSSGSTGVTPVTYRSRESVSTEDAFADVLEHNLACYGVMAADEAKCPLGVLSEGLAATLGSTKLIAVDSALAAPIANALSYATSGTPAAHASIPADWNDASALEELLGGNAPTVLVLDGPVDTVNEGLLFALTRLEIRTTVILPIGAYANLRLVAGEVWDRVFYVPAERYVPLRETEEPLRQAGDRVLRIPANATTLEYASRLHKEFDGLISLGALALPGAVASVLRSPLVSGSRWVSAHLALRLFATAGMDKARKFAAGDGGSESAHLLLKRIDAAHAC